MKVIQYISELLLIHDCVIIPGFGGFIATHVPAHIQPVVNSFSPPQKEILFNSTLKHNDGLLATYIAQKENISFEEALAAINMFVEESLQQLKISGKLGILHVGTIMLDSNNYFQFQQDREHNLLLTSYGLTNFISPAIQREGIEKRIEKAFSDNRTLRSEHKSSGIWAKVAMISVPAAAVFVWAFVNVGPISDVTNNYTNITSIFSGRSNDIAKVVRSERTVNLDIPDVYENTLDIQNSKSIFKPEPKTLYPVFSEFTPKVIPEEEAVNTVPSDEETLNTVSSEAAVPCKFFIIGSCNRVRELAENYKSRLISKGYKNANILEPKGSGLYKVYIDCYETEEAANAGLNAIHNSESPEAWLLKM